MAESVTVPTVIISTEENDFDDVLRVTEVLYTSDDNNDDTLERKRSPTENTDLYSTVTYSSSPVNFSNLNRYVFIPNTEIHATIIDYERNLTSHLLNPNSYVIQCSHGEFQWCIRKRYKHFQHLHHQLSIFKAALNFPFPTKAHKNNQQQYKSDPKHMEYPRFPMLPEILIGYDKLDERIKQLERYLNNLLSINIYRNHPATIEFLEVSELSFRHELGAKGKEGILRKRTGSIFRANCFGILVSPLCLRCRYTCNDLCCSRWIKRWFFIKETCFGYINPKNGFLCAVVLFDEGFEAGSIRSMTPMKRSTIYVETFSRHIIFECWTRKRCQEWLKALKTVACTTARDFIQRNDHNSFAPCRQLIQAAWFVDGSSYMSAIADALNAAKREIFITDWWLSPEIYLKRPAIYGHQWRLDQLLIRKAKSGVKVYILLYKEFQLALGLNSYYSKQKLSSESPNIKVLRHPDHAKVGVYLWAHHEKIVVVDQTCAFVGGIDLCYGRWDDENHRLTDLGSLTEITDDFQETENPQMTDTNPKGLNTEHLTITNIVPVKATTPIGDRKNLISIVKDNSKHLVNLMASSKQESNNVKCDIDNKEVEVPISLDELNGSSKFWIGKDYVNFIVKDFSNLEAPFDDFIERRTTPRMPWHDIGVCIHGAAAKDVARHFIQRWNTVKLEKMKFNPNYPYLLPESYQSKESTHLLEALKICYDQVTCQVLRSASNWSCGFVEPNTVEQSIHEAYLDTINKAEHYIYIENQFFISLPYSNLNTKNQVGEALFKRILRAFHKNEVFRVYVVMPLLPGFEGEIGAPSGTALHAITHWNYSSICRGKDALLTRLRNAGIEKPEEYVNFFGLRTNSILNGKPVTELIYVHSKLMIVDDRTVICGSANINDRSLIGKRDSEVAVLIRDEIFDDGIMNGSTFRCGRFAGSLRKYLFQEHLGLLNRIDIKQIDVTDPAAESFYQNVWCQIAIQNTEIYDEVFHCIPNDKIQSFTDLKQLPEKETSGVKAKELLKKIQGNLVILPLLFLVKENLTPASNSVQGILPTSLWT